MPSGSEMVLPPEPDEMKFRAPDHTPHRHLGYLVTGCKKLTELLDVLSPKYKYIHRTMCLFFFEVGLVF